MLYILMKALYLDSILLLLRPTYRPFRKEQVEQPNYNNSNIILQMPFE